MVYFPTFTIIYYKNQPFVQANIPYMDGMGWHGHGFTMFHISLGCEDQMLNHLKPTWNQRWITERTCSSLFWTHRFGGSKSQSIHVCHIYLVLKNNQGIEKQHPCHSYPIYKTFVASEHTWATEKKNNSSFPLNPGWLIGIPIVAYFNLHIAG